MRIADSLSPAFVRGATVLLAGHPLVLLLLVDDVLEFAGERGEAVAAERHDGHQRVVGLHQVFLRARHMPRGLCSHACGQYGYSHRDLGASGYGG